MTTRLDRLFLLLDTGSTPLIRKSAAEQLGEVQKLHPYELHILLSKVHGYLRSGNWDTRIAAGQAVEAIAKNVPQWEPRGGPKSESGVLDSSSTAGRVMFSQFNIEKVLQHGASLLGSEGAQYDLDPSTIALDDKERLKQERQQLNKRLGLDMAGYLGIPTDGLDITNEDVTPHSQSSAPVASCKQVADLVRQQLTDVTQGMSARERNKAKRKAKHLAKQISKDFHGENAGDGEPSVKKMKENDDALDDKLVMDPTSDNTINPEEIDEWPFESFCELLMNDLFNSAWEVRHGAATGLREIIKIHGRGAGKTSDTPADQLMAVNQIWLGDLGLRLLCVLALDKFGDYVSDEVVAPVRETSAQALGVVLRFMDETGVTGVKGILLQFLGQGHWQVRHGGLLGLKYMLAVRQDLTQSLLPQVMLAIYQGLRDTDDDVRAVAAAALVPVCNKLVASMPDQVPLLVSCLWEILLDLDDLTASTNSVMTLLATLLSHPTTRQARLNIPLTDLTPRLWPFLRHNIASVRKSALETFHTLLIMANPDNPASLWLLPILPLALMHVFQRSVLEDRAEILVEVERVWEELLRQVPLDPLLASSIPNLAVWLVLLMQPAHLPFDPSHLVEAKHRVRETTSERQRYLQQESQAKDTREYIGGFDSCCASPAERDVCVTRARMTGAKLLGMLACYIAMDTRVYPTGYERPLDSLAKFVVFHLNTKSAIQRYIVSQVVYQWACHSQQAASQSQVEVKAKLLECLNENVYFDEIALAFTRMQADCRDFIASLKQQGVQTDALFPPGAIVTLEQATMLTTTFYAGSRESLKPKVLQVFDERSKTLQITVSRTSTEHQTLQIRVLSSLAMAVVMLDALPEKLNPVIRPLMECIKKEENAKIQEEASKCLSVLLQKCLSRNPCPNPKILKNLCMFLCSDTSITPLVSQPVVPRAGENHHDEASCDIRKGILTLTNLQKTSERSRRWYKRSTSVKVEADTPQETPQEDTETQRLLGIQRHGAEVALTRICTYCGPRLEQDGATLWEMCHHILSQTWDSLAELTVEAAQELVHSLQVLEVVGPSLHQALLDKVLAGLGSLSVILSSSYTVVRHMVGRCLAMLCQQATLTTMQFMVESVLPMLNPVPSNPDCQRQGAVEALANVIELLGMEVVPYIVLLVVPVLACMSDQNEPIRLMATHCFASLIRLMPLEAGIPDPPEMKASLVEQKEKEREFLEQLLDGSKLQNYHIKVEIKADLRKYQKDGVNWLAFLNKYKLHGILCDDMGLGKTLQSICVLANDHFLLQQQYKESKDADCAPIPSIVVCPPTLVGHWVYEVGKFVDKQYLNPLMYAGPPAERTRLQKKVKKHNLIVASYDVVRNDIDFFSNIRWNYCILDEGHIIRNGKTKLSKAVKQLVCRHRLILSGTPIQNNVLDLWSLFDFLMPGFLGTERQFQARYGKPILLSRDAKSTTKEQEAGALAMEALHRQVLPFVLRRLKEDVLQDLPPKIIQDYYCDLSPLQVELYEDFAKSRAKKDIEDSVAKSDDDTKEKKPGTSHIFQALQYLRKVCNHPALVLNSSHPQYSQITARLQAQHSHPRDLQHAPKLTALKQLLNDCGIGVAADTLLGGGVPVVNQHRVLLFCQLKSMLDIVEFDLFKEQMSTVTYLRLDGSVPPANRHNIVHRFNNDPSIDILLLTTHVGGLGLNLTGADTVVFVEHDWNPMKDLQAMDRAHRIGQKKVVNVYRLITRGTLEEKIMGLQKFKLTIANTVISQDNASLQTMGTDQLLELFTLDDRRKGESAGQVLSADGQQRQESAKSVLESLEELWDERQYETEYNLDSFMKTLT